MSLDSPESGAAASLQSIDINVAVFTPADTTFKQVLTLFLTWRVRMPFFIQGSHGTHRRRGMRGKKPDNLHRWL